MTIPTPTVYARPLVLEAELVEAESNALPRQGSNLMPGGQGYDAVIGDRTFPNPLRFDNTSGMLG